MPAKIRGSVVSPYEGSCGSLGRGPGYAAVAAVHRAPAEAIHPYVGRRNVDPKHGGADAAVCGRC